MTSQKSDKPHVLLSVGDLDADEKKRDELVGAIKKNAPTSPLYTANTTIQAQVGKVDTTNTTYKGALAAAAASKKQHDTDVAAANKARVNANKAIRMLANLTENDAVSEDDIKGMAFTAYTGKPPAPALVAPLVGWKPGTKGSGRATASVQGTGRTRYAFAADQSLDGTNWAKLVGSGKSRKLNGKSGTTVWVRFALEHKGAQSDWSVPIQITFP